jgi:hypothetical protein
MVQRNDKQEDGVEKEGTLWPESKGPAECSNSQTRLSHLQSRLMVKHPLAQDIYVELAHALFLGSKPTKTVCQKKTC